MGDDTGLDKYTDTGNMCYAGDVKTPFATRESIDSMKEMLATAKPDQVLEVADAWKNINDHLVGGSGSVKGDFDKAVDHVLQHWEGESADEFAKTARKISKQISDCAKYAEYTSIAMRNAGQQLSDIKPKVDAIEKPSGLGSAMDKIGDGFSRDDEKWRSEISGNQGAQSALDNHDGDLSAGKEEQLKAAALMETLALTYSSQTKTMGTWEKRKPGRGGGDDGYPGEPGGVAPVPVPVTSDGSGPGTAVASASKTGSVVGKSLPKTKSPTVSATPGAATKVDGIKGGTPTAVPGTGGGAKSVGPTAGVTGGPSASAGPVGGGPVGGPGFVGKASGNRSVTGAGAGSRTGIGGARGGAGQRVAGGIGAGGRGGAAGGVGNRGGKNVAGRGPLAKSRGGVLDTPEQGKGAARQGGAGLHSSRGGAMAGERGRNAGGVMGRGGVAGNNARRKQDKNDQGERPDYLVEDEETWMPERRDVAPPTVG
ncbi:hypothetical protein GCM10012287_48590 [Streptomyces daqingensis]|uniref:PPE family domain-containing protein n=1 Tax=Streptomyces daqingensis TaxID=1472640 RepID=A0ABQ2MRA9_9ACTN|nr:hypothetical protein [Streptomyces daqingensis]GGO56006.1 hypothetical protein GCM10012287_48590 [Streptomyces daqingensis]